MGNKVAAFTEDQLEEYQVCTYLNRQNILRAHRLFRQVTGGDAPKVMNRNATATVTAPFSQLDKLPLLKDNPFRRRICQVFSEDASGNLNFDQFLDLFSAFSDAAPREIKVVYAFKIYDFDEDGFLGGEDLLAAVQHLTHGQLSPEECNSVVKKVLEEADLDCDGRLSPSEFSHTILKCPYFLQNFKLRV
ncbi:calcium and integrin-binding family member 3 [Hyalella azteca]|uniref:Calcium and integrin-binding family member 3 n=1 Tax=Hyalella azteca TaxID=294128 RepID=A0A8B7P077_HYAAZ|nr:calcium and integrin-binding family member 3 [Hyalella azteca]